MIESESPPRKNHPGRGRTVSGRTRLRPIGLNSVAISWDSGSREKWLGDRNPRHSHHRALLNWRNGIVLYKTNCERTSPLGVIACGIRKA